ncbi:MAG: CotH kinase family protein [Fibromonadaceae bacterium]|jgi:hypothetical protein|nr:CotH kinase family protein [Fibromonadaceae bacterium]
MNIKSILTVIACLALFSFAALPQIRVTTTGNQNPDGNSQQGGWQMPGMGGGTTKKYYAVDKVELTDPSNSRNNLTSNTTSGTVRDSIKVRGNSTAGMEKKPYRIKFATKKGLFGKEEARSWVLLANWYDGTFALNAIAFEMGRRMGLEFTNSSQLVDLWINGTYKGIYQLTEQIQSHKGRVDLKEKHNGWLVEFDYHDPEDQAERNQAFNTNQYSIKAVIKWPQLDDTSFTKQPNNTAQLNFVKNDVNNLMTKMSQSGFPNNDYRDLIDLESYAKYVLIQLVLDNFDFNSKAQTGFLLGSNYLYKIEECDRIKAGPLWDFDLAAGIERMSNGGFGGMGGAGSFPAHYKTYQDSITPTHAFYRRLWEDPVFKAKYKKNWDKYINDFKAMSGFIDNIKSQAEGSIQGNGTNRWGNNQMSGGANLTTQVFNTEVQNLKTWWNNRINWVDNRLKSYNIDTSKDITQNPPAACAAGNKSSSSIASSSSANNWGVSSSSSANNWGVSSSSSLNNNGQATLSCTGLQSSVERGGTINQPNVSCSNGSQPTNINWNGRPQQNGSWTTNAQSTTASYTISVTATCGQAWNLTAQCGTVTVGNAPTTPSSSSGGLSSSSSEDNFVSPIVPKQALLNIRTQTVGNVIVLENLPSNTKVELYNLQGNRVYSTNSGNSGALRIQVQTGMYVMRATLGSEKKVQRFVVK